MKFTSSSLASERLSEVFYENDDEEISDELLHNVDAHYGKME